MSTEPTATGLVHKASNREWHVVGKHKGQRSRMESWKGLSAGQRTRQLEIELMLLTMEITGHRSMVSALKVTYWLHKMTLTPEVRQELKQEIQVRKKLVVNLHAAIMYRQERIKVWRHRTY